MGAEAAARDSHGVGLRATPAVLRDSTRPLAEAEEQEWRQEETERSVGATGELLTERPVMKPRGRLGCGLGQGRAGARARTEVRETRDISRGRDRDHRFRGASRRACHARPRLPEWRARTAAQPGGGSWPSSNGAGLRKTLFQCGRIRLRVKLGHPAVNGSGRPRG